RAGGLGGHARKASAGLSVFLPLKRSTRRRWVAPYVMLGLMHSTKLAFKPLHRPRQPSGPSMTSSVVPSRLLRSLLGTVCCRVVTTATGIVKMLASMPATAPRASSTAVLGGAGERASQAERTSVYQWWSGTATPAVLVWTWSFVFILFRSRSVLTFSCTVWFWAFGEERTDPVGRRGRWPGHRRRHQRRRRPRAGGPCHWISQPF